MLTFAKSYDVTLQELKQPHRLARLVRELAGDLSAVYSVHRKTPETTSMKLMSKDLFDLKVDNLDPLDSLPILQGAQTYDVTSASLRMDELYRLVAGVPYDIYDYYPTYLEKSGTALKTSRYSTQPLLQVENKIAAGGQVTANHPITAADTVSARKPAAALTVGPIADLEMGVLDLFDGVPLVANGTAVELIYATQSYKVAILRAGTDQAVLVSTALITYLDANSI